eukprot:jgi/Botrbrau1/16087/Bobra.7_2s0056.1
MVVNEGYELVPFAVGASRSCWSPSPLDLSPSGRRTDGEAQHTSGTGMFEHCGHCMRGYSVNSKSTAQALTRLNVRAESKADELRGIVRALRTQLQAKQKQLDLAERTLERLSAERCTSDAEAASGRACIRKLEAKLAVARDLSGLQLRCSHYQLKLRQALDRERAMESRRADAEEEAERTCEEAAALRKALEIHVEDFRGRTGADVHSQLLYGITKGREEAVKLKKEVVDERERAARLQDALAEAQREIDDLKAMVEWHEERAVESAGREAEAEAQTRRWKRSCQSEEAACRAAEERLRLLACERDSLTRDRDDLASDIACARDEVEGVRAALRTSETDKMRLLATSDASVTREQRLLAEIASLKTQLGADRSEAGRALADLQAQLTAVKVTSLQDRKKGRDLQNEIEHLKAQVDGYRGEWDEALVEQATSERSLAEEKAITKDLQRTVANLQRVMALSHSCRDAQETALTTQVNVLTREMEGLAQVAFPLNYIRGNHTPLSRFPFLHTVSFSSPVVLP